MRIDYINALADYCRVPTYHGIATMDTAQHSVTRCPVYLHPAAASNPTTIASIQRATGQVIVLASGRPQLQQRYTLPAFEDFGPFDGAA